MISILLHLARHQPQRPLVFGYAASSAAHYPHRAAVEARLTTLADSRYHLWLETLTGANASTHPGRMDLAQVDPLPANADIYLCGPQPFMEAQRGWLLARSVARERIHYEVFGPDLCGNLH